MWYASDLAHIAFWERHEADRHFCVHESLPTFLRLVQDTCSGAIRNEAWILGYIGYNGIEIFLVISRRVVGMVVLGVGTWEWTHGKIFRSLYVWFSDPPSGENEERSGKENRHLRCRDKHVFWACSDATKLVRNKFIVTSNLVTRDFDKHAQIPRTHLRYWAIYK